MSDKEVLAILEKKERKKVLSRLQSLAEEEGHVPPPPCLLLGRMAQAFQYSGGILIGVFLGLFTLVFNFILFVLLLHLEF
jgi:hypothetical protein